MAVIEPYKPPPFADDEKYNEAIRILDKIIVEIPSYGLFKLDDVIVKSKFLTEAEKQTTRHIYFDLRYLLIYQFGYVKSMSSGKPEDFHNDHLITAEGEKVKKAGGHFNYILEKEKDVNLSKRKLSIDVRNAERIYKSYWSTRLIAWIGLIISILLVFLKIAEILMLWPYRK